MKATSRSERFHRLLLHLLPFDFRREYESDMEAVFREQEKEVQGGARGGVPRLLLKTVAGILRTAPREHFDLLRQDVRYAVRTLSRSRAFAAVSILTLALGIGANTAIYSVVDAILLRPLPFKNPDQLVMVWTEISAENAREQRSAYANVEDWKQRSRVFEDLAINDPVSSTLTGQALDDDPEQVSIGRVSENYFAVLGVQPAIGRVFTREDTETRARVIVLSHGLWKRRFGGMQSVLGRTVLINGVQSEVIGVMPESFASNDSRTAWEPAALFPDWDQLKLRRGAGPWFVYGRLKPDVELDEARTDMQRVASELEAQHGANAGLGINVVPLHLQVTGQSLRVALWVLMSAVGLLLLIACSNIANILLARATGRRHELAVRSSLGASRLRLVRQLSVESFVLAAIGGTLGLFLAQLGLSSILWLAPERVRVLSQVGIDGSVIGFTVLVSIAASTLFGIVPALRAARVDTASALAGGMRTVGMRGERRTHRLLVVFQFALSALLLCGAGLLVRSLMALQSVDPGFQYKRILFMNFSLSPASKSAERLALFNEVLTAIRALPDVEQAGLSEDHFISSNPNRPLTIEGGSSPSSQAGYPIARQAVDPQYFQTLRISVLSGTTFSGLEHPDAPPSAVINNVMARRFWPGQNAVGKRFKLAPASSNGPWFTVIGVVGDMRRQAIERDPIPQVFVSFTQDAQRTGNILIRTKGDPLAAVESVRQAIRGVTRTVPMPTIVPLETRMDAWLQQARFQTSLLTIFSVLALLLAAIGIYGLMSYSVSQRSREIGIRMALGARFHTILVAILSEGMRLAAVGVVLGLGASFGVSRSFSALLYGVQPGDVATFVIAPVVLLGIAALATYLPARRAASIDPVSTLR